MITIKNFHLKILDIPFSCDTSTDMGVTMHHAYTTILDQPLCLSVEYTTSQKVLVATTKGQSQ